MQKVNATVSEMLQQDGTLADASSTRFPHNIASSLPRASQEKQQIATSLSCLCTHVSSELKQIRKVG
jgi:hypothetical protein